MGCLPRSGELRCFATSLILDCWNGHERRHRIDKPDDAARAFNIILHAGCTSPPKGYRIASPGVIFRRRTMAQLESRPNPTNTAELGSGTTFATTTAMSS